MASVAETQQMAPGALSPTRRVKGQTLADGHTTPHPGHTRAVRRRRARGGRLRPQGPVLRGEARRSARAPGVWRCLEAPAWPPASAPRPAARYRSLLWGRGGVRRDPRATDGTSGPFPVGRGRGVQRGLRETSAHRTPAPRSRSLRSSRGQAGPASLLRAAGRQPLPPPNFSPSVRGQGDVLPPLVATDRPLALICAN